MSEVGRAVDRATKSECSSVERHKCHRGCLRRVLLRERLFITDASSFTSRVTGKNHIWGIVVRCVVRPTQNCGCIGKVSPFYNMS
jgi:hypothetical protein